MKSFLSIIFLSFFAYGAFVLASDERQNQIRKNDLLKELKCMTCAGQSVLDSESEFALSLRDFVGEKINEGKTNEQIFEALRISYGNEIFFRPPLNNQTILLWILPFFLIFVGFIAVVIFLKKNTAK